jgi:hypothetical protein
MSKTEPIIGIWHDAATGETIVRELTAEEIAELPEPKTPLGDPE